RRRRDCARESLRKERQEPSRSSLPRLATPASVLYPAISPIGGCGSASLSACPVPKSALCAWLTSLGTRAGAAGRAVWTEVNRKARALRRHAYSNDYLGGTHGYLPSLLSNFYR